jgi:hypothetical protein
MNQLFIIYIPGTGYMVISIYYIGVNIETAKETQKLSHLALLAFSSYLSNSALSVKNIPPSLSSTVGHF